MKKTSIIVIILFSLILTACTAESTNSPIVDIDMRISDYFPKVATERRYIEFDDVDFITNDIVKSEPTETGGMTTYIQEFDEFGETSKATEYEISEHEIRIIYQITPLVNQAVNHIELTNKKQWNVGDIDNSIRRLTNTNLELSVHAGLFTDVIEVTEEVLIEGYEDKQLIFYYAPKVGLIKAIAKDNTETIVFRELYSYVIDGVMYPSEQNGHDQKLDEENDFVTDDVNDEFTIDENEVDNGDVAELAHPQFRSGKRPPVTNNVSTIHINDYHDRVNDHTIEQGQGPILHRPDTIERPSGEFSLRYYNGIHIQLDENGNIIDVMMTDEVLSGEELFLHFNWLIQGLDEQITNDEVNAIIFPSDENIYQYFEVGQFNVGIEETDNGILLMAVVR